MNWLWLTNYNYWYLPIKQELDPSNHDGVAMADTVYRLTQLLDRQLLNEKSDQDDKGNEDDCS